MTRRIAALVAALLLAAGLAVAQVGGPPGVPVVPVAGALGATNAWTGANSFIDTNFSLKDDATPTKIAKFQLSGLTAGTNTFTLPNASTGTFFLSTLATNAPDVLNSVWGASNGLVFEGATANAFETTLTPADPSAARTVTLADASGTVVLSTLATNAPEVANSVTGASNALVFEGATGADTFQTSLTPQDPTADRTVTIPNESGYVALSAQFNFQIPSDGAGTPAAYTLDPSAGVSVVTLDCADANGCEVTMGETHAVPGQRLVVIQTAATAGAVTLIHNGTSATLDGAGNQVYTGVGDAVQLVYISAVWVQVAPLYDAS